MNNGHDIKNDILVNTNWYDNFGVVICVAHDNIHDVKCLTPPMGETNGIMHKIVCIHGVVEFYVYYCNHLYTCTSVDGFCDILCIKDEYRMLWKLKYGDYLPSTMEEL